MDLEERLRSTLQRHAGVPRTPDEAEPAWDAIQTRLAQGPPRRHRAVAGVVAAALAMAGIGFLAWAFLSHRGPRPVGPQPNGVIVFVKAGPLSGIGVDNTDLFAVNPDGTGLRNLTNTVAAETDPVWSPDGTKVAFVRTSVSGSQNGEVKIAAGIYVMNAGGSGLRRIRPCPGSRCRGPDLAWSPDGTRLAFVEDVSRGDTPATAIMVMNMDGSGAHELCQFPRCSQGLAAPRWSPDGTKVVFSNQGVIGIGFLSLGILPSAIFVADADGTGVRKLTGLDCHPGHDPIGSCSSFDSSPSWSPDGSEIAFSRLQAGPVGPAGPGSGRNEQHTDLVLIHPDGTGLRVLASCSGFVCPQILAPEWSPDSSAITYRTEEERSPSITVVEAQTREVRTIGTCAGGACVTPGPPIWAPDGRSFAFLGGDRTADVYAIGVDGSGLRRVARDVDGYSFQWLPRTPGAPALTTGPSQTPASAPPTIAPALVPGLIAFTNRNEIYTMRSDGTDIRRLTFNRGGPDFDMAWSADGTKMAFASIRDGRNTNLFVMNADGSGQRRLTDFRNGASMPTWSPDGGWIAFHAEIRGLDEGIFFIHPDGSGLRRITVTRNGDWNPAWSPDGTEIAFSREVTGGSFAIFLMRPDGSGIHQATDLPGGQDDATWTPDGSGVVFHWSTTGGEGWYVIDRDGTGLRRLTAAPAYAEAPLSWSPDGSRIAFTGPAGRGGAKIETVNAEGGGLNVLTWGREVAWQPIPGG